MKVAVLGMGSWGTALAQVLVENGHQVMGWAHRASIVDAINEDHCNEEYLPGHSLPETLVATLDLAQAVRDAQVILLVLPVSAMRSVSQDLNSILQDLKTRPLIVHASKGLEQGTHWRLSQVIEASLDEDVYQDLVVLSGPSHAEEVVDHDLTTITAASLNLGAAETVQNLFMNSYFRVYTNQDVVGVEMGAALKNIIALGAGVLDGFGYGDNAKAALITRGLAEITRLGVQLGADPMTFSGLSGVGDLIVTCMSPYSRNYQAGRLLGQGYDKDQVIKKIHMVVEGLFTTQAAYELAQNLGVEMPITEGLYHLIYGDLTVQEGLSGLMGRAGRSEVTFAEQARTLEERPSTGCLKDQSRGEDMEDDKC